MGYIYLITNTINKKQYVGQTICKDINSRWKQHKRKEAKTIGNYLLSAYQKYGIENFRFQIICICFDEDCNRYEEEYIKKFKTLAPNGYNLTIGSKRNYVKGSKKGSKLSEETKKKIGESLRRRYEKYPEEKKKGKKNPNYGKSISNEQKKKISESMIKNYKIKEDTGKSKLSEKALEALRLGRENNKILPKFNRRPVGKYNENNKLLEKYTSISEASRKNKIGHQHISKVCNGLPGYITAGGFKWNFLSDDTISI